MKTTTAVGRLAVMATTVGLTMTIAATAASPCEPLFGPPNAAALSNAIAALPNAAATAALVMVTGSAGSWSGSSGVAAEPAGPVRPDDEFRIGSVSKTFVATVVLQLVAEHRISLGESVQRYLPGLLAAGDPPITVAELLNHTSGLGPANGSAASGDPGWFLAHRLDTITTGDLLGTVLTQPLRWAPGTHQQYNGVNYLVLGMLIEKITGHSYAEEIQRRIIDPLDLDHTFVPLTDPTIPGPHTHGYYQVPASDGGSQLVDITDQSPTLYGAQGAMISTVGDLTRFMTALLGGDLLPPAQLRDMFRVPKVATGSIRYGMRGC